jgi:hypothetical protein
MRSVALLSVIGFSFVVGCASAPPPKPVSVETTSAVVPSREAFTPPDQWEMQIADRPAGDTSKDAPASKVQPDTTAGKRQSGGLVTMPGKRSQ